MSVSGVSTLEVQTVVVRIMGSSGGGAGAGGGGGSGYGIGVTT